MSSEKPKSYAVLKSGIIKATVGISGQVYLQDSLKKDLIEFQNYYGHSAKAMSDIFKMPISFFYNVKHSYKKKQSRVKSIRWKLAFYEKKQSELKKVIEKIEESEYWSGYISDIE